MHNLYAFPRARFASYSQDTPYQKQQPKGQAATGQATCSDCHARIDKGAFYRELFNHPVSLRDIGQAAPHTLYLTHSLLTEPFEPTDLGDLIPDCSKCRAGTFDLCDECFELGEHCLDNDHVLVKFYAWKYIRHVDKTRKARWKCSNEHCIRPDRKNDFFFGKFLSLFWLGKLKKRSAYPCYLVPTKSRFPRGRVK